MRHGFILSFTLYLLLIVSVISTAKYESVKNLAVIEKESEQIYRRLRAEHEVFDEILFNLSLYIEEDFEYYSDDYSFYVSINQEDVKLKVEGIEEYSIKLKYNDDCICFIEILYN